MQDPIYPQVIAVWYTSDQHKEALVYSPQITYADPDYSAPDPFIKSVKLLAIQDSIKQIRGIIHNLLWQHVVGKKQRDEIGVEAQAQKLAAQVLPEKGFVGLVSPGIHPQLDLTLDATGEIPWEALEEWYHVCPDCGRQTAPSPIPSEEPRYCEKDRSTMQLAGGKLALTYHLTHLARGDGRVSAQARRFLLIEDPTGDLAGGETSTDPQGVCRQHLDELRQLLEGHGYEISLYAGKNATSNRVLSAIKDPDLAGMYFFGHGRFSNRAQEGSLRLADRVVSAVEIEEVAPTARFVFLNVCEAANVSSDWGLEKTPRSVAHAFARGGRGKVVIAPICPVANTQAAETALTFFRNACSSVSLAESLRAARKESLDQYNAGCPHISWMAYRYFGNPNKYLPVSIENQGPITVDTAQQSRPCRVFDENSRLNTDVFGLLIDEVLLRAAKRMNLQQRTQVTVADIAGGLVRKGDLTRYVLQADGIDPDEVYKRIGEHTEVQEETDRAQDPIDSRTSEAPDSDEVDPEYELRQLLATWIIRGKRQFHSKAIQLLFDADRMSQEGRAGSEDVQISEQDVLSVLIRSDEWSMLSSLGLPSAESIRRILEERDQRGEIDENGAIRFDGFDSSAKSIIQTAHVLAQQRGIFPIANRVMLAAFLMDEAGYGARVVRYAGGQPKLLFSLMLATIGGKSPETFGLSAEACARIVIPVLQEARRIAPDPQKISEQDLFRAFCEKADPNFKKVLRGLRSPMLVNLDQLRALDPPAKEAESSSADASGDGEEDFDPAVLRIISQSNQLARKDGWTSVTSPHLFAAMIEADTGPLGEFLQRHGMPSKKLKQIVLSVVPAQGSSLDASDAVESSQHVRQILERTRQIASSAGRGPANEEVLYRAFFSDGGGVVGEVLRHVSLEGLMRIDHPETIGGRGSRRRGSIIEQLGLDLTEEARQGNLSEVVGRDSEIQTAIETLLLTENANPLLIGEAGVGKTAIVSGIAQYIVKGICPERLRSTQIIELSAGELVADTRLRGEFEQRIQELLAEATGKEIVLFIDEIHTIVGAGASSSDGLDAGNMLKASLANGAVRIIGSTTLPEYRRTIARDKALLRRFQQQMINPPSREGTIHILNSVREHLEKHHSVKITDQAIVTAVDLSGMYIHDKHWPAKARDVLDRACVVASSEKGQVEDVPSVLAKHSARVVSNVTSIPLERVSASEQKALKTLEERISRRIIGQPKAIRTVADAIRRGRQGLTNANRPWGVFLFLGPPGVGKTELAKVLSEEVFGGSDSLIRFDMGDFSEPHSAARLVGAPPGYIGYEQGAPLVERLRARPYSLLLFDEIEHAHENVLGVLLRLFTEGTLVDADGMVADARNCIIILTSNAFDRANKLQHVGFTHATPDETAEGSDTELRTSLLRHLSGKLIDRLDAIILFKELMFEDMKAIAAQQVSEVVERFSALHGVSVEVAPEVYAWLAREVTKASAGARDIQRAVDRNVTNVLGAFLSVESQGPERMMLAVVDGVIRLGTAEEIR